MWVNLEPFGYNLYGETIGSAWMNLVGVVLKNGHITSDEGRERLCLQNIRIKFLSQVFPDPLMEKYGNKKNIDEMDNQSEKYRSQILDAWSSDPFVKKYTGEVGFAQDAIIRMGLNQKLKPSTYFDLVELILVTATAK